MRWRACGPLNIEGVHVYTELRVCLKSHCFYSLDSTIFIETTETTPRFKNINLSCKSKHKQFLSPQDRISIYLTCSMWTLPSIEPKNYCTNILRERAQHTATESFWLYDHAIRLRAVLYWKIIQAKTELITDSSSPVSGHHHYILSSPNWTMLQLHVIRVTGDWSFCDWLISLSTMSSRVVHVTQLTSSRLRKV